MTKSITLPIFAIDSKRRRLKVNIIYQMYFHCVEASVCHLDYCSRQVWPGRKVTTGWNYKKDKYALEDHGSAKVNMVLHAKRYDVLIQTYHVSPQYMAIGIYDTVAKVFTPQPLRAQGYCRRPTGRAGGRASPVNTLTSVIFHGSFSNLARTFNILWSRTSLIMEVLPHYECA